jgi:hypothetical protein
VGCCTRRETRGDSGLKGRNVRAELRRKAFFDDGGATRGDRADFRTSFVVLRHVCTRCFGVFRDPTGALIFFELARKAAREPLHSGGSSEFPKRASFNTYIATEDAMRRLPILFVMILLASSASAQNIDLYGSGPTQGYSYMDEKGQTHSGWINHWSVPLAPAEPPGFGIESSAPAPSMEMPTGRIGGSRRPFSKRTCENMWAVMKDPMSKHYDPDFLKFAPDMFTNCQPLAAEEVKTMNLPHFCDAAAMRNDQRTLKHCEKINEARRNAKSQAFGDNLMAPEYRAK